MAQQNKYFPLHYFIYGPPGTFKTTLVSTFPKPMKVLFMDAFSKDIPYLKRGTPTEDKIGEDNVLFREVVNQKGQTLISIDYIHENNPDEPIAYDVFVERLKLAAKEQYKTIVVDSFTSLQYATELKAESLPHQDDDGWFVPRKSKEFLQRLTRSIFPAISTNLVIIGHVTKERFTDKTGKNDSVISFLFTPAAPGTLKEDIPRIFPEVYVTRAIKDGQEKKIVLQTHIDSKYVACTQINAPDLELEMDEKGQLNYSYKDLWLNVEE